MKFLIYLRFVLCFLLIAVCAVSLFVVPASAESLITIDEVAIRLSHSPSTEQTADDCVVYSSVSGCGLTEYGWFDGDGSAIRGAFEGETAELRVSFEALRNYRFSDQAKLLLGERQFDCTVSEDGTSLTANVRFYFSDPVASTHQHTFGGWEYDNRTHWRRCEECGQMNEVATHTMVWESTSGAVKKADELQKGVCSVCGYSVYRGSENGFSIGRNRNHIGLFLFLSLLVLLVISIVGYNLFARIKQTYKQKKKEKQRRKQHHHHHHHHHHSEQSAEKTAEQPAEKTEDDGAVS